MGEGCSLRVETNQLDGIFHVAISKFKLDDNRNIEDEVKFGTGIKYGRNERISSSAG
ncbi:hypothetical protein [Lysinibacillus sphaericus]|uniref:hypothetical protein n=1 Tax=Lysinibacillus sphaericus TaxID=1421 RepID=UPI000A6EB0C4|nr:hypothetical protein [Lysinibacillus sphaericus]QIC45696.1 hypothetical protein GAG94_00230 [Lysinibacillus sphaericus]QPA60793.1 hypothetical protein INQ55_10920 [Lysinibacillus sphaericus]